MEEKFELDLNSYFEKNGILDLPINNKQRIKLLRRIIYNERINIDIIDLMYAKSKENGTNDVALYLDKLNKAEINIYNALYHIDRIKHDNKKHKIKLLFIRK